VAVTCHYDVVEWLEPDWVLDMATGELVRGWLAGGRLRRPPMCLEVFRCRREMWRLFAKHHYLSGSLSPGCRCYVAAWEGEPVAFAAVLRAVGGERVWRISRVVVLPDFQGIGIGGRLCAELGELYREVGERLTITTSHPAMIAHLKRSRLWRVQRVAFGGRTWSRAMSVAASSRGRTVVSAEYVGRTVASG
jgi:GNAT superfamily N-acetyltransferase